MARVQAAALAALDAERPGDAAAQGPAGRAG
jgi:hypothetical protein